MNCGHDSQYFKNNNQNDNHLCFPESLARRFLRVHPKKILTVADLQTGLP
jgi:hypothetical protein